MRRLCLFATLAAALLLRLPGIEWGLPPATPQVVASDFRSSYAFDEDDILSGAAKADVRRFDFDPHEYHWGTLHIELVLLALDGAQANGTVFGNDRSVAAPVESGAKTARGIGDELVNFSPAHC